MNHPMDRQAALATGSVGRLLMRLALPCITAQVVNMLYNVVDRIYIGHIPFAGTDALTGVGVCFPLITLITAFSALFGMGGAPRASIAMGRGDQATAERVLGNCLAAMLALGVVLTVAVRVSGAPLLLLFGASASTLPYSLSYLNIYVLGSVFVMVSVGLNAFLTAQGFAAVAMKTTLIGAVLNIALDPLFIFAFGLGAPGAAAATVLSQAVSAAWVLRFLFGKKNVWPIRRENLRPRWAVLGPVLALGLSPFIMQSTESLLSICFNASLQRYGGDAAVGTMSILASVMQIIMLPMQGLAQGAQPILSYNWGARNFARVRRTFLLFLACAGGFSTAMWALVQLFPQAFAGIFSSDPALVAATAASAHVYLGCVFASGVQTACQHSFLALGQSKQSLLLALLRKVILLIPLIFILPNFFADKVFAVFLAEPVADLAAAAVTCTTFALWFGRARLTAPPTRRGKPAGIRLFRRIRRPFPWKRERGVFL